MKLCNGSCPPRSGRLSLAVYTHSTVSLSFTILLPPPILLLLLLLLPPPPPQPPPPKSHVEGPYCYHGTLKFLATTILLPAGNDLVQHIVTRGRTVGTTQLGSVCCAGSSARGTWRQAMTMDLEVVRCGVPREKDS